jgi:hypothetical protein
MIHAVITVAMIALAISLLSLTMCGRLRALFSQPINTRSALKSSSVLSAAGSGMLVWGCLSMSAQSTLLQTGRIEFWLPLLILLIVANTFMLLVSVAVCSYLFSKLMPAQSFTKGRRKNNFTDSVESYSSIAEVFSRE